MQLDDAEALLAVYGDVETMQHLNSDLPATVEQARKWVQTKINLFDQDDQLSLWTVIHSESGQIVGDVGLQHEDYALARWSVSAAAETDNSGVRDSASRQPAPPLPPDSNN